jgi:hypothetical protein
LRPLPESRSSSKKPPRRSVEKMRASRLAHRKFAKSLCQAVGSQRVAGKSLIEKFRPRPGPLAKNRRGKMKAAQERSDQHAAAKHRTQSLPLPVHTSCTVLRALVLCRVMMARGYDFKKKQHSDLAGNRPQRQDIPVRRGN